MVNTHIFSMSVTPAFDDVVAIIDEIARKHRTSRSNIMRVVAHSYFGVPMENVEDQEYYLAAIEMELSNMQNQQQVAEVKC